MNLRVMEKEDLPLFVEWVDKPEFLVNTILCDNYPEQEVENDHDRSMTEVLLGKRDSCAPQRHASPSCDF